MRAARISVLVLFVCAACSAWTVPAHAAASFLQGGYLMGGFPTGDWGKVAGFGLAIDGTNVTYPKPDKPFAVRSSLSLLYNFSRTAGVPSQNLNPGSKLDLETKNTSLFFGIGPEFSQRKGETSPFVFGTVGFNTYWTSSNLSGTAGGLPYFANQGDSRIAFAWAAGLGVRKHVTPGETVEISVEYRSGGGHRFVLPGQVTESGGGVNAQRDERTTNQILVRLGTVLGY
jgi:opacity protein-like surface antigen